jgi:TPR repeat protein
MSTELDSSANERDFASLSRAYECFINKKYDESKIILMDIIETDKSGYASLYLGSMHYLGLGVEIDKDVARKHFKIAAERGIKSAQYNLGSIAEQGNEWQEAYSWYLPLATAGDPASMHKIYKLSSRVTGSDKKLAEDFLKRSATKNYGYAKRDLQKLELGGHFGRNAQLRAVLMYPVNSFLIVKSIVRHLGDKDIAIPMK